MFHHRIRAISQNSLVLICSDSQKRDEKESMPAKSLKSHRIFLLSTPICYISGYTYLHNNRRCLCYGCFALFTFVVN